MRYLICFIFLVLSACSTASTHTRDDLQTVFRTHGIENGTFVLLDAQSGAITKVNASRADTRFAPASTFKIANSLIALQTGAVRDTQEIIPYGGGKQPFPQWEHDMALPEAIKVSNVPVYQEVARRIGLAHMVEWVEKLDYGNQDIGTVVDRFWLDGPLEISALEQAHFLARLTKEELPINPSIQRSVQNMVFLEEIGDTRLYGKTGWLMSREPNIGWLVGWVVKGEKTYTYALNIDVNSKEDTAKRMPILKAMLEQLLP